MGTAILAASTAVMGFAGDAKRPMATFFQLSLLRAQGLRRHHRRAIAVLALGMACCAAARRALL